MTIPRLTQTALQTHFQHKNLVCHHPISPSPHLPITPPLSAGLFAAFAPIASRSNSRLFASCLSLFSFPGGDPVVGEVVAHGSEFDADRDRGPDAPVVSKEAGDRAAEVVPGDVGVAAGVGDFQADQQGEQDPPKQVEQAEEGTGEEAVGEPGAVFEAAPIGLPEPAQPAPAFALDGVDVEVGAKHGTGKDEAADDEAGVAPVVGDDHGP